MTGYVRQSVADILPGEEVRAEPLNAEFNRLQMAFNGDTGHTHDGTPGSGPKLNLVNTVSGVLPVANGGTGVNTLDGLKAALSLGTAAYTSLSDYATAAQGTRADGALQRSGGTMSGPIAMGNQKITGLAAPTADTDASTRKFVTDTLASVDTSAFASHVNNKSNPHEVTKAQVGLGNVENLSRAGILADAALTGTPTAPTPAVTTNTTQIATTSFVQSAITNNVPVATASDINTSTGTGFANAQTLGPILQGMKDTTTAVAGKTDPVGSYLFWPQYAKVSPGLNWLEAKGQIVSTVSYPTLASVLPTYPTAFGAGNPTGSAGNITSTPASKAGGIVIDGDRYVSLATGAVTVQDLGSSSFSSSVAINPEGMGTSPGIARPITRGKEVIYFMDSAAGPIRALDTTSQSTLDTGEKQPNVQSGALANGGLIRVRPGDGLYKTANGTIVSIMSASQSYTYRRLFRLRPGLSFTTQWEAFDPPHNIAYNTPTSPDNIMSWQTKNGNVFVAMRAAGSTAPITIYRTDGTTWTVVSTFNFQSTVGGNNTDVLVQRERLWRQDLARKPINLFEESPDGQQIIISLYYGYLVSRNGGTSFTYITANNLLGYGTTYYPPSGNNDYTDHVSMKWSKLKSCWYFTSVVEKAPGGGSQNKYAVIWTSTDLVTFTKIAEVLLSGMNASITISATAAIPTNTKVLLLAHASNNIRYAYIIDVATLTATQTGVSSIDGSPIAYLERISDEYATLEVYNSNGYYGVLWVPYDDSEAAWNFLSNQQSYGFIDFGVTTSGTHLGSSYYVSGNGTFYQCFIPIYNFNPTTERRLPNVSIFNTYASNTTYNINEVIRPNKPSAPRVYIKVS